MVNLTESEAEKHFFWMIQNRYFGIYFIGKNTHSNELQLSF